MEFTIESNAAEAAEALLPEIDAKLERLAEAVMSAGRRLDAANRQSMACDVSAADVDALDAAEADYHTVCAAETDLRAERQRLYDLSFGRGVTAPL